MDRDPSRSNPGAISLFDLDNYEENFIVITAAITLSSLFFIGLGIYLIIRFRKNKHKENTKTESLLINPNIYMPILSDISPPNNTNPVIHSYSNAYNPSKPDPELPTPPIHQSSPKPGMVNPPLFQIPPQHGFIAPNNSHSYLSN